ncbi:MAG: hypothetical protein Q9228_003833, partial [Teloschistes exilis]
WTRSGSKTLDRKEPRWQAIEQPKKQGRDHDYGEAVPRWFMEALKTRWNAREDCYSYHRRHDYQREAVSSEAPPEF